MASSAEAHPLRLPKETLPSCMRLVSTHRAVAKQSAASSLTACAQIPHVEQK